MRITESKLRSVIRSVVKESIGESEDRNLDSAIESVKGRDSHIFDNYVENFIMYYIDAYHIKELASSNNHGNSDRNNAEVISQSLPEDYSDVLRRLSDDEYSDMVLEVLRAMEQEINIHHNPWADVRHTQY
jgi:hypothetical protein